MAEQTGRIVHRTCPLCEATCGLEITVGANEQIVRIRGDRDDVFSKGFICPKGSTLKQLHEDPDRLRAPLMKRNGVHVEVTWAEAWQAVHDGLTGVIERHGRGALSAYVGNPNAHNLGAATFNSVWLKSMGSRNFFSASTVDQIPKHVAGGLMFGTPQSIPVPDLDRTDYLLMLGANPYASNGSLCTAPDFPGRLSAIRERGGKVVTVDPRRTKTADASDEWVPIRPGTDGFFLAAIVHVLFEEGLVSLEPRLASLVNGLDELRAAVAAFTPELAESTTRVPAATTRRIARELAAAPSAAVYGRIGVNTVEFGTLNAWLIDAINVLTGNIDTPGGAMFTLPAVGSATTRGTPGKGKGFVTGRGHSRVSNRPEVMGEYPTAVMAEEILEPGDGQVRAMITVAGNPVVSTQNSSKLDEAFSTLEFMVSVDIYLNETTRHADVILPPPSALEKDHYDVSLYTFAVRNVANYSPPVLEKAHDLPDEWEILARLAGILQGMGPEVDPALIDDTVIGSMVTGAVGSGGSAIAGRDAGEILDELSRDGRRGPARILDFMLQTGPYGAAFGANPGGLSLDVLLANPHGVDLGALEPRLPEALRTPSGKIELAPEVFVDETRRLAERAAEIDESQMLLVGRRDLKSNNSWFHNMKVLTKGSLACTAQLHPDDARRVGVASGDMVRIESRVGVIEVVAEVTDSLMPGVVSVPHGWGHGVPGTRMSVAAEKPGVNSNVLTDEAVIDPLSGNGVLSAIPVTVTAASN